MSQELPCRRVSCQLRKAQKKAARRKRALIFVFGSSFLRCFESLLRLWMLIVQFFVPLMCVLVTGKLLGTLAFTLNVTLHLLAPIVKLVMSFVLAIPCALNLVASILQCLCWLCCFHFYIKLLHIFHCCGLLPDGLRPLLSFLCVLPRMYYPVFLVALSCLLYTSPSPRD